MVRIESQKTRDKDKRIQRKFGISLEDRDARALEQNHKCKICGGPLDAYGPPNIDHFHFFVKALRVTDPSMLATGLKWEAESFSEQGDVVYRRYAKTKEAAIASVKQATMPWSIRGLLCFKCNRGLGSIEKFFNAARHPENLIPIEHYLRARLQKA